MLPQIQLRMLASLVPRRRRHRRLGAAWSLPRSGVAIGGPRSAAPSCHKIRITATAARALPVAAPAHRALEEDRLSLPLPIVKLAHSPA
jgi:hypothetical protein